MHGLRGLVADIYLDGTLVLPTFQPERSTDPLAIPAGDHLVEIRAAGAAATETPLLTQTVTVPAGFQGSLVAHLDADGNPTLTAYADDLTAVPAGESRVVVRHAAAADDVTVLLNEQPAFPVVAPKAEADRGRRGRRLPGLGHAAAGGSAAGRTADGAVRRRHGQLHVPHRLRRPTARSAGRPCRSATCRRRRRDPDRRRQHLVVRRAAACTLALVVARRRSWPPVAWPSRPAGTWRTSAADRCGAAPSVAIVARRRRPRGDRCRGLGVGGGRARPPPHRRRRRRRRRRHRRDADARPTASTTTADVTVDDGDDHDHIAPTTTTIVADRDVRAPTSASSRPVAVAARCAWSIPASAADGPVLATGVDRPGGLDVRRHASDARVVPATGPTPGEPGSAVIAGHLDWKGVRGDLQPSSPTTPAVTP